MHFLSIVEEVFEIQGRGTVVLPGIPHNTKLTIFIGDKIHFRCPDEHQFISVVSGIEMIRGPERNFIPLVFSDLSKPQVPIGTELYLLEQDSRA